LNITGNSEIEQKEVDEMEVKIEEKYQRKLKIEFKD